MSNESEKTEVPIVQEEFANFLRKYKVAKGGEMCDTIAENIAETGGADVFETPEALARGLGTWSEYIGAPLRKQILQHWFAKKHIEVSPEAMEAAGVTAKTETTLKKKAKLERKTAEGTLWTVDVDESGTPRIRMIKDETEPGVTLAEAKMAAKEIGKEREAPIVVYSEEMGRHMPNFKSPFVKQNLAVAWATARQMDKAISEGEPADPMDVWIEQQAKIAQFKEVMGVTPEPKEKTPVGEIVSALKDLKAMAEEGKVTGMPDWVTDPVKFLETVRGVTGAGEGKGLPEWMTDPAKFIETVETITGKGKGDETLRTELTELKKTLDDMKEQRHKEQIESQQRQIGALTDKVGELTDLVVDLRRPVTGRTEMDLLHEVATEGITTIKTEAAGMRGLIKEAFMGGALPPPKTAEERVERTQRLRQAVQRDKEIEELGRRVFFGEGREITPQQPETVPPQP